MVKSMSFKKNNFVMTGALALVLAGVVGCGDDKPEAAKPVTPAKQEAPAKPPTEVSIGTPTVNTAVSAPPPGAGVATPPPGSAPAAPGAAAAAPEVPSKDALEAVTHAVQSFFINKERAPKNLEELVASGFLKKLPTPPAGKKYVYDPERANIVLADQ